MFFISLREIMSDSVSIYAHRKDDGSRETLSEHITRCENYFQTIWQKKDLDRVISGFCQIIFESEIQKDPALRKSLHDSITDMLCQMIVFHDSGKLNPVFQKEKMQNYDAIIQNGNRCWGNGEHSFLSSLIYLDYFLYQIDPKNLERKYKFEKKEVRNKLKTLAVDFAYIISRHHSDLHDLDQYLVQIEKSDTKILIKSVNRGELEGYRGFVSREFTDKFEATGLTPLCNLYNRTKTANPMTKEQSAAAFLFTRLAYSLLVMSDFYATSEFTYGMAWDTFCPSVNLDGLWKEYKECSVSSRIADYQQTKHTGIKTQFNGSESMNDLRCEMFLETDEMLRRHPDKDIYFLEAPTGSGKSNTALNLSLKMAAGKKKNIFYVYPFNTLVEQNLQTLESIFSQTTIQENIAVINSITPIKTIDKETLSDADYTEMFLNRQFLNYPFILTTHVSFCNILFSGRRRDVFAFLQLSDSVVVLDEIQSYRNSIWSEIIIFLAVCARLMGMKVIIMSATLPGLQHLTDYGSGIQYLLQDSRKYYDHPVFKDRVQISYDLLEKKSTLEQLTEHIAKRYFGKKILIEFISKRSACCFYQTIREKYPFIDVECITGDTAIIERDHILRKVKAAEQILLIATQVVEAGVDIDMDIGYKDISCLDSEEQFLGRINRSCKKNGIAYFFDMDDARNIYAKDDCRFLESEKFTLKKDEMKQILLEKQFGIYYDKVLEVLQKKNRKTSEEGLTSFFSDHVFRLAFKAVQDRMQLISDTDQKADVVLCRKITLPDGTILHGQILWEEYVNLLQDATMCYAKKQIRLSEIRCKLNHFV